MKVKVCGIKSSEQMRQLQQLGVDYAGMIFYEGSKRYAGEAVSTQQSEIRDLPVKKVGVFVNAGYETILKAIFDYGLYAVQLHGDETDEFCLELMDKAKVIKVFRIAGEENIDELTAPFQNVCHYFLFDTNSAPSGGGPMGAFGGSGKKFDWKLLEQATINKPFFLSGGIGPEDVEKLETFHHPHLYAVDINSRFETEPGLKDLNKVKRFVDGLRS